MKGLVIFMFNNEFITLKCVPQKFNRYPNHHGKTFKG